MRVAVIGTGSMGAAMAAGLRRAGHEPHLGSRDPGRARTRASRLGVRGGTYAEATDGAAAIILAVPFWSIDAVLPALGDPDGAVIVDCTNPVVDHTGRVQAAHGRSGAEEIAREVGGLPVVKCFNHIPASVLRASQTPGSAALLCGEEPGPKALVAGLAADMGFDPVDLGPLTAARVMESMAGLLLRLANGPEGRRRLALLDEPIPSQSPREIPC